MSEAVERNELVDGLRRAVGKLYNCRYSEIPIAEELDDLLKRETGQTYGEWVMSQYPPGRFHRIPGDTP